MKFSNEDYGKLKLCVIDAITDNYTTISQIREDYNGQSEQRFLWDLYWKSKWSESNRENNYLDSHIESAMRKVVKELEKEETEKELKLLQQFNNEREQLRAKKLSENTGLSLSECEILIQLETDLKN